MEAKHTPGTWLINDSKHEGRDFKLIVYSQNNRRVALCYRENNCVYNEIEESYRNAKLIAAAPELLEALKEVIAISDRDHSAWDYAKSIIKKATE
jgi:hypothetical protein